MGLILLVSFAVLVFGCGYLHAWLQKVPLAVFDVLCPVGYGLLAGYLATVAYKKFQLGNKILGGFAALIFSLGAAYGNVFWFAYDMTGELQPSPAALVEVLQRIVKQRSISINFAPGGITGDLLLMAYVCEAVLIVAAALYIYYVLIRCLYYCKRCHEWSTGGMTPRHFYLSLEDQEALLAGDVGALAKGSRQPVSDWDCVRPIIVYCKRCERGHLVLARKLPGQKGDQGEEMVGQINMKSEDLVRAYEACSDMGVFEGAH